MAYDPLLHDGAADHYRSDAPPTRPDSEPSSSRNSDLLARTRFRAPRVRLAPGTPDLVRDAESVLSGYFSLSYCAPHLFGDRIEELAGEVRALLRDRSPEGVFWDWPGDTEVVLART